ncbi:septal ring lytic transglycosylase RlpA family protein [Paenochrobactrum pullorum]|uniref:septal ring lytic transglycosylase RlpA family protein n=1 Tax=Paenochrobactrum pullorum TaxID=1324351 RepID=UPI0035BC3849
MKNKSGWYKAGTIMNEKRLIALSGRCVVIAVIGSVLTACAGPSADQKSKSKARSKEYFAESQYGVKASPRVTTQKGKPLPRGGGRDQVGKPYKVRGKWYKPKEDPNYKKTGRASWYGDAFHGRLTANGEIYDMHHLTAAHPTMPLPSYAKVTNLANGSSLIVRVNDRGPYSNDRIIDLSKQAADMLDYTHHGTADVKVEYVGRAPLDGQDDQFLMASFRDGSDPIGQPATGVMMAMNGPTPTARPENNPFATSQSPFAFSNEAAPAAFAPEATLPSAIPLPMPRPAAGFGIANANHNGFAGMAGYASDRIATASFKEQQTYGGILSADAISASWRKQHVQEPADVDYVNLGSFTTKQQADKMAELLKAYGKVSHVNIPTEQSEIFTLTAVANSGDNDALLRQAWKAGAVDAFVVRVR